MNGDFWIKIEQNKNYLNWTEWIERSFIVLVQNSMIIFNDLLLCIHKEDICFFFSYLYTLIYYILFLQNKRKQFYWYLILTDIPGRI